MLRTVAEEGLKPIREALERVRERIDYVPSKAIS